ncbi:MAG: gliding motility protein GldN [Cyclobacteriaceae bacterium]|nr:gliding motility protein GldN [Cyclobacteriaceae bacterium]
MNMFKNGIVLLFAALMPQGIYAQVELPQYNPNSIDPIPRYEHLYKLRVWRKIDMKEKQNKGFFSNNGEISKLIIDAVRSGEIPAVYNSDSLTSVMTKEDFESKMVITQGETLQAWDPAMTYYLSDAVSFNGKNYESAIDNNTGINPSAAPNGEWVLTQRGKPVTVLPRDIYMLTLMEDVIFDKRRSRLYYDIQAIKLEAFDLNTGTFKSLGWFKYKDLEKVFRNNPAKAVWFNRQNTAENKNFADAFLLRLFKGTIDKIENPDDQTIEDVYRANQRPYYESVWAREWAEMMLMEKEHNLWEF